MLSLPMRIPLAVQGEGPESGKSGHAGGVGRIVYATDQEITAEHFQRIVTAMLPPHSPLLWRANLLAWLRPGSRRHAHQRKPAHHTTHATLACSHKVPLSFQRVRKYLTD